MLAGDHPADAAFGIVRVAPVPGDEMAVAVHHALACCRADIEPDVVPVGPEIIFDDRPALVDQVRHCLLLFPCQGKLVRSVPERDDQQVPFTDREPVPAGIAELVFCNDIIGIRPAEPAPVRIRHGSCILRYLFGWWAA